jgi:hypothetical protein
VRQSGRARGQGWSKVREEDEAVREGQRPGLKYSKGGQVEGKKRILGKGSAAISAVHVLDLSYSCSCPLCPYCLSYKLYCKCKKLNFSVELF